MRRYKKKKVSFKPSNARKYFKRVAVFDESGDMHEEVREVSASEYADSCRVGEALDSFYDAMQRVPDVDYLDKFYAIDQLSAAIAGLEVVVPDPLENVTPDEK